MVGTTGAWHHTAWHHTAWHHTTTPPPYLSSFLAALTFDWRESIFRPVLGTTLSRYKILEEEVRASGRFRFPEENRPSSSATLIPESHRHNFASGAGQFFFVLTEHESDVLVMELESQD